MDNKITDLGSPESWLYLFLQISASYKNKTKGSSIVPEMVSVIGADNFLKLVHIYEGKYVRIPSKHELIVALYTILYFYDVTIKGNSEEIFCTKYSAKKTDLRWLKKRAKMLMELYENEQLTIPDEFQDSKIIKEIVKCIQN